VTTKNLPLRIVARYGGSGGGMVTQSAASTGAENAERVEHPEQQAIERAVMHRLNGCGCDVRPDCVRDEVRRALERFRDARIRQYVSIFVTRDVCRALLEGREQTGATL
jgi:hypothetical protein